MYSSVSNRSLGCIQLEKFDNEEKKNLRGRTRSPIVGTTYLREIARIFTVQVMTMTRAGVGNENNSLGLLIEAFR